MKKNSIITLLFLALTVFVQKADAQKLIFKGGHSHNDYHQPHPLTDALKGGMVSVEADIFLEKGKILVGHSKSELTNTRTLVNLYLHPLWESVQKAPGKFSPIILLVDIKTSAEPTYALLKKVLEPYHSMLTHFRHGKIQKKAITIILSGNRPIEQLRKESDRYVFIDGRIPDISHREPSSLFPLISDNWNRYFSWRGKGAISTNEYNKLRELVDSCHQQGKMIRFWGMPADPVQSVPYWNLFRKVGVDLIGCDCPSCYKEYLEKSRLKSN